VEAIRAARAAELEKRLCASPPLRHDRVAQGVGGRLAVPSVHIAAEPRWVGAPLVGALAEGRHEACPYVVIELQGVGGRLAVPWFRIHPAKRRVGQALPLHLRIAFTRSNAA
jgi:hypothetical protein